MADRDVVARHVGAATRKALVAAIASSCHQDIVISRHQGASTRLVAASRIVRQSPYACDTRLAMDCLCTVRRCYTRGREEP